MSTAVIPLPPGLTLDQFQDLQSHLIRIAITASVAFGVIIWDYFVQLPSEIALYKSHDKNVWKTPVTWWFIILRYSGIIASLPSLFFTAAETRSCQVAISASAVGAVLTVASSGAIFWYRIRALWSSSLIVSVIAGFFYLLMLGCWISVATQYRGDTGPDVPFLSNCQLHPVAPWAPISFASSVAYDTCVLLLTLARFRGNNGPSKSKIGRQVYNDNLLYFVLITATNIVVLCIQAQRDPKFDLIKPAAVPFATIMTVAMGTRVFLNLRLYHQRQQNHSANASLPLHSSSLSSDPARRPMMFNSGSGKSSDEPCNQSSKVSTIAL
ncbi:hypothetical protein AGABI1DRAFT_114961 [Agaricus bisporus var. burnettii JB137-S8]|uniref:Uncharacterized protein n=1 Tax=Agaricus bisporus var. burnettii (strain JB137-S8 / ATCC MYA-4627 / FGSC 10392) TaxID=597362 RepID=K5WRZ3_AGABU|nr:uncharacterized protein AGABI1DRAFT_114961 [Agaricus bisporus var. burnettii JB137-S8]EKM78146.1 hypothetical protein AGABI1DRAFT_114961 [Agaricus bisporus var. burnettii JB137-S8]